MKCQVCGKECGQYVICSDCYEISKKGEIKKCIKCGEWHFTNKSCNKCANSHSEKNIYESKTSLLSSIEKEYFECIKSVLPEEYYIYPQVNLASIINRVDVHKFQNELFRNIDFGVFNKEHKPVLLIEIQDKSHLSAERQQRDEKVRKICEEADIVLIEFWEIKNIDPEKIKEKIYTALNLKEEKVNEKLVNKIFLKIFPVVKMAFCFFSIFAFYYADEMYNETGEKYQCFIGALFPLISILLGLVSKRMRMKSTASLTIGILFFILLLAYPFVYQ